MNQLPNITESEWLVMETLWGEAPLTAAQIVERAQAEKRLVGTTIKTLLRRLISKGAVGFTVDEHNAKLYHYFPLVTEQACVAKKSRHFLSLYYKDNVKKLFSAFVDNSNLSDEEIENLQKMLERKKGDVHE